MPSISAWQQLRNWRTNQADRGRAHTTLPPSEGETTTMRVERYGKSRYWAVRDAEGMMVCVCVYKRGALEVMRRLQIFDKTQQGQDTSHVMEDISSKVVGSERD